jgi:hypothetical protein
VVQYFLVFKSLALFEFFSDRKILISLFELFRVTKGVSGFGGFSRDKF